MNSGSFYYNYKGFFSIVLLSVIDDDHKFLYWDIGANGASSDAGIFNDTELKEYLEMNQVGLPYLNLYLEMIRQCRTFWLVMTHLH